MKRFVFLILFLAFNNLGIFNMFPNFKMDGNEGGDGDKGGSGGKDDPNNKNDNPDSGNQGDPDKGDGSGDQAPGNDGQNSGSIDDLPDWAKKEIKGLRSENAKHRTNNNNLTSRLDKFEAGMKSALGLGDDDKLSPEEQIEALQQANQESEFEKAVLRMAMENGMTEPDEIDYFSFLLGKKADELKEGEELSDDDLASIIQKAKGKGKGSANSSVDGDGEGGDNPPPGNSGDVTLDQFVKMNILEKSKLYSEKPDVYNRLLSQAKAKGQM